MEIDVNPISSVNRRSFLQSASAASLTGFASTMGCSTNGLAANQTSSVRKGSLIVYSNVPMNAEPAINELVKSWLTPIENFYIRSHAPVPKIDAKEFRLSVEGLVHKPLQLSISQLSDKFKQTDVIATMCCAGNRRNEHGRVKPVGGVQWKEGPIGNARWGGIRLSDVLKHAGLKDSAKHVWFEGLDAIDRKGSTIPFGASIPLEKALLDTDQVPGTLLANQMNGVPLTPDHGYPLRTVVPGYIGARSVKWVGRIVVSDRPSPNHYVATAYKLVEQNTAVEWAEAGPIYRLPLNSAICDPLVSAKLRSGMHTIHGYALPSGKPDVTIARVEVSADGGRSWTRAKLGDQSQAYCWRLWSAQVSLKSSTKQLTVRATDTTGRTQPAQIAWNLKGYMFNAWHNVPIRVGD